MARRGKLTKAARAAKARAGRKLWGAVKGASGLVGFIQGVIGKDLEKSPTFQDPATPIETKFKLAAAYFLGRVFDYNPFTDVLTGVKRKVKPFGWMNESLLYAAGGIATSWALSKAPNFPLKGYIQKGLRNGAIPISLGKALGGVFSANPHPGPDYVRTGGYTVTSANRRAATQRQ